MKLKKKVERDKAQTKTDSILSLVSIIRNENQH